MESAQSHKWWIRDITASVPEFNGYNIDISHFVAACRSVQGMITAQDEGIVLKLLSKLKGDADGRTFDIIGLCEKWIEEREWGNLKLKLPIKFVWKCQYAVRIKRKGRARGGIITGVRQGIEEISIEEIKVIDGIQERRLRLEGRLWRIITIYNNSIMKSKRREIEDILKDLEEI